MLGERALTWRCLVNFQGLKIFSLLAEECLSWVKHICRAWHQLPWCIYEKWRAWWWGSSLAVNSSLMSFVGRFEWLWYHYNSTSAWSSWPINIHMIRTSYRMKNSLRLARRLSTYNFASCLGTDVRSQASTHTWPAVLHLFLTLW